MPGSICNGKRNGGRVKKGNEIVWGGEKKNKKLTDWGSKESHWPRKTIR